MKEEQKQLSEAQAQGIWDKALEAAFEPEDIKVNRESYLNERLQSLNYDIEIKKMVQDALNSPSLLSVQAKGIIDELAKDELLKYKGAVSSIIKECDDEMSMFRKLLERTFVLIQRLCYLYKMPELWGEHQYDQYAKYLLTLYLGTMFEISSSINKLDAKGQTDQVAELVAKRRWNDIKKPEKIDVEIGIKFTQLMYSKLLDIRTEKSSKDSLKTFLYEKAKEFHGNIQWLNIP